MMDNIDMDSKRSTTPDWQEGSVLFGRKYFKAMEALEETKLVEHPCFATARKTLCANANQNAL